LNPTTGMFQTLVAATSAASQNLVYANALADSIYVDYQPVVATPYTTLNVLIPTVNEGNVVDIQAGPIQPVDYAYNQASISFNKHFSETFVIKSWDQIRTPADLSTLFMKPAMEALLRKVNRTIANAITSTNFNTYTTVTGAGTSKWARADLTSAWNNLVGAGVPVEDTPNMFFITTPLAYSNMLNDQNFIFQYIVGDGNQTSTQDTAKLRSLYGSQVKFDQHLSPASTSTTAQTGLFFHRYAIAAVTANPPSNNSPSVMETTTLLKNKFPVQVQLAYSLQDQGWIVHLHLYWGLLVARPEMGSYMATS
jgi:hypothetical protein